MSPSVTTVRIMRKKLWYIRVELLLFLISIVHVKNYLLIVFVVFIFQPGDYVRLHIARFSRDAFKALATIENYPLIVVGLLPYEQKMSLLNVTLKHSSSHTQPIKSKERLIFQCGFRRFMACPIFSQHTNGTKHKVRTDKIFFILHI